MPMMTEAPRLMTTQIMAISRDFLISRFSRIAMKRVRMWGMPK